MGCCCSRARKARCGQPPEGYRPLRTSKGPASRDGGGGSDDDWSDKSGRISPSDIPEAKPYQPPSYDKSASPLTPPTPPMHVPGCQATPSHALPPSSPPPRPPPNQLSPYPQPPTAPPPFYPQVPFPDSAIRAFQGSLLD